MRGEPHCLLCGGEPAGIAYPFGTVWNGRRFDYLRCGSCGASFIDPPPTDDEFRLMYRQSDYHDEHYGGLCEPTPTRLETVIHLLKPAGRLLDFGCGNGAFMVIAKKAGFHCEGIELDAGTRRQAAANSNCPTWSLEEVRAAGTRYDVIHLGDVLEHLPDPAATMEALTSLLADGGLFFVEGPLEDNASPVFYASRLFGRLKKTLGRPFLGDFIPYHLFRASARAQRRFFEKRLGWHILTFGVTETGWPYIQPGESGGLGGLARRLIGMTAVAAAGAGRPLGLSLGNRFATVVAPSSPGVAP